jgi:hypothetical protein
VVEYLNPKIEASNPTAVIRGKTTEKSKEKSTNVINFFNDKILLGIND